MTKKKVPIKAKSKAKSPSKKAAEDAWVEGQASSTNSGEARPSDGQGSGKMKRLTIDVSEDLHRRIKVGCAGRGVKMADEIREMLEKEFGEESR